MATNTYVALNKVTANGTTSTISFTSIPQTYTDLVLVVSGGSVGGNGIKWRANGDATTSYGFQFQRGSGSGVAAARYNQTSGLIAWFATNTLGVTAIANFMNYSTSGVRKSVLCKGGYAASEVSTNVNTWTGTAPITSLEIFDESGTNILSGTTFSLYGIKTWATESTPKATGGYVYQDSTYWYHAFLSSGTFTPSAALTNVEYVVVAGGGGGGENAGSPGGAGGYRSSVVGEPSGGGASAQSRVSMNSGTAYTITVGAGGAGNAVDNGGRKRGAQGSSSSITGTAFTTVSCTGGGYGTSSGFPTPTDSGNGGSGGSGGAGTGYGGGDPNGTGGSGTTGEGYAGGSVSVSGSTLGMGGGGGAGGVGGAATGSGTTSGTQPYEQGNGGIGVYTTLAAMTNVGEGGYLAGGGAGGEIGMPGLGGGGGPGRPGYYAIANSGGGGGAGAAGASGVVIVRYAK